jgi:hypothetical protein
LTAQLARSQQSASQLEKSAQSMAAQVEDLRKKVDLERKRAEKAEKKANQDYAFGGESESGGKSKGAVRETKRSASLEQKAPSADPLSGAAADQPLNEEDERQKLEEKLRKARGAVVGYDAGWNLVVVNLGDADGVTMESPMKLVRNGKTLAYLRIAKVDAKRFVAKVEAAGGKQKVDVKTGDSVVYASENPS